jgi:hypothetical protein
MNESEAGPRDPRRSGENRPGRDVPPWMVVNERIPWPGFTQAEWDRLLLLRDRVRAGRVTEGDRGVGSLE